ncbi:ArnT family glycosyltransferase [Arenibaculum pallidiluteum]|uniref:ArnT family glycosyltransferase n=1 Tax=Arenibaculum pallidiluteum TaxID=2812559 RepID=UPI002E2C8F6B|nr:glycosyltransferase family 39 protein [Arenibaculum pallidiluteum]
MSQQTADFIGFDTSIGASPARSIPQVQRSAWDQCARLLLLALLVLSCMTFLDYGVTTDEEVQHIYGKRLLSFYLSGFQDMSAFTFKDLFRYGGLFDLMVAVLIPVSPFEEYETRHLLSALFGVVGVAGTWRLGRLVAGPRAGFMAALLLALSGVYYGGMFNNTKDVPFAAGMVWSLYYATRLVLLLPRPRLGLVLRFGAAVGLTLGIRVGALFLGLYLGVAILAHLVHVWRRGGFGAALGDAWGTVVALWPCLPVIYALMAALWPWSVFEPLNPIVALQAFSHIPFTLQTLYFGELVYASDPPALYLPAYLLIKLPEALVIGTILGALRGAIWLAASRRGGWAAARPWLMVGLAAFLPIVLFMIFRPTIYNGIRHFLFIVPPMAVIAARFFDDAWAAVERLGRRAGQAAAAVLATVCLLYAFQLGKMHPNQYVYYNQFVGGIQGAYGRFEMDYWGNSLQEATRELVALVERENDGNPPDRTYTLSICGNPLAVRGELPSWLRIVDGTAEWRNADFFMAFTQVRRCPQLLDGQPVIEISAEGVPLSVVKDRREPQE